ncbi:MAG: NADH-quinone oxidoreductase subunit C, partial [Candidatus Thermoplasmatota archaeon]|nr:NADH-quinone oxidoreductase subunit C [Candidatus Thermoplasmatota archaeon]
MIITDSTSCDPVLLAQYVKTHYDEGWKIMSMFASESSPGATVNVVLRRGGEVMWITSDVTDSYPAVTAQIPAASVFERVIYEMNDINPEGHGNLIPAIYWRTGDGHPL